MELGYGDHGERVRDLNVDWEAHKAENERIRASGFCGDCGQPLSSPGAPGICAAGHDPQPERSFEETVTEFAKMVEDSIEAFTPKEVLESRLRQLAVDHRILERALYIDTGPQFDLYDALTDGLVYVEQEIFNTLDAWERL